MLSLSQSDQVVVDGMTSWTYRPLKDIERVHVLVRETFDKRATGVIFLDQEDGSRTESMSSAAASNTKTRRSASDHDSLAPLQQLGGLMSSHDSGVILILDVVPSVVLFSQQGVPFHQPDFLVMPGMRLTGRRASWNKRFSHLRPRTLARIEG
jgi:hypothetical protein